MKRLFWDIETSPNIAYTWRSGHRITIHPGQILKERAIICVCYKWEHEKRAKSIEWNKGDDKPLLEEFLPIAEEADELVAHNGDKFDLKWFQTRCLKHGLPATNEKKTVDTLAIARRRFYFNSNKLDYIAKFLGLDGKDETNFGMWEDIVQSNCPRAMAKMVKYCKRDVYLLEDVWRALMPYHNPKTHEGVLNGDERWTCPRCGSANVHVSKTLVSAKGTKRFQMKCNDCGGYYTMANNLHEQYQEWRRGQ